MTEDLFTNRKSLDEICSVPDKIISVYSLEQHVWADGNSNDARKNRTPEIRTIEEFQIDPVRPFLNDIFRKMAAPYEPKRKESPIGQGYWIQAEFGSGKSHLLSFLSAATLGNKATWEIIAEKEKKAGRGKRESLYRFWEEGLEAKSTQGKKGIFVVVKTLVGVGGGTAGISDKGQRLSEYILGAVKEQLEIETGKNISLYPAELLADRFIDRDLQRYRNDLKKFLKDPNYFDEDEFEDADIFIQDIQQNKSPQYKNSCGQKLWRFYTEYLQVQPHIEAETEDILKHMVQAIIAEGYAGLLLVLDEVSLFMKNRDENQRIDDEKTLVVLSNRLAKVFTFPVWTVCAAQQAIESKMSVKNIIADDRLKLVKLLDNDQDYYDIVLARVREIKTPNAIGTYYVHYKKGFSWPNSIGEDEFRHFFPFHKPALEVLKAVTYELTTTRSAIHFMHQTLKYQIKIKGNELIRLWELFDEAVRYEEDPSGVHAGLVAIKTKKETEYRAYESCKRQIDGLTKGHLKVYRDKAIKIIQTLFLYHVARLRNAGISAEEISNSVLIERDATSNVEENIQHYETLADNLKKELRQIVHNFDEDNRSRYRFDPVFTGVDPRDEFQKARSDAESNELMLKDAWDQLLALDEWNIRTRQMTIDLSCGIRSIFKEIAHRESHSLFQSDETSLEINWQGRHITGKVVMRDFNRIATDNFPLTPIDSDQSDDDFALYISQKYAPQPIITKLLAQRKDPRILLWTPGELTYDEKERLIDFAAYRKMVNTWKGKETEDAVAVVNWVYNALQTDMARISKIIQTSYARGEINSLNHSQMEFHVAGDLSGIVTPLVDRILTSVYESRDIQFELPYPFRKEEGIKVINGIVKTGHIPKGAKPNQNISAAQNFGFGLMIMKHSAERQLDVSGNRFVKDLWNFINDKLTDDNQIMKIETLYKNFMGIGGPKDYGLTRRMVQIFLLCLVREGKIRVSLSPKSGLAIKSIDLSNIETIEFSAKIMDALLEVQKVAKPENWEILRPYAGKLLGTEISATLNDSEISSHLVELVTLFAKEKDQAIRFQNIAQRVFHALKIENPYQTEWSQMQILFASDITGANQINLVLNALKQALGYAAFDSNRSSQTEVDDLANRLANYQHLKQFLTYESEIVTATIYCQLAIPDGTPYQTVRAHQQKLTEKLSQVKPFIDSEVCLKTELIGKNPPEPGENGTFWALIHEYSTIYLALHDKVVSETEAHRNQLRKVLESNEFKALKQLEKIVALQPEISYRVQAECEALGQQIYSCPDSSRTAVQESLMRHPAHTCELTFGNAAKILEQAGAAVVQAQRILDDALDTKLGILLSPQIKERLQQGQSENIISEIINCSEIAELRKVLISDCLKDSSVVDRINRFLKWVVVRPVKISEFAPSVKTIEKNQIPVIAREFQQFLENAISDIKNDNNDVLPMIQLD